MKTKSDMLRDLITIDKNLIEVIVKVNKIFNGDLEKTYWWIKTKNPNFGGVSPQQLFNFNRGHKVLQFVNDAEAGNLP